MSARSAIYIADTFRHLSDDMFTRQELNKQYVFGAVLDGWTRLLSDKSVGPHIALMCCAFAYRQLPRPTAT